MQLFLLYIQIFPTFVAFNQLFIYKANSIVMKKKNLLFACSLLGVITFSSCEKNLYDESKQPEKEITMTDLEIPAGFKWDLTQVAKVTTSAKVQTMVSLYLDEKCSEESMIAEIPVYTEAASLPFSLPSHIKTIYAKYESGAGIKKESFPINSNGNYIVNIENAENTVTRAVTRDHDIEDDIDKIGGVVYHPSAGWGTIMFEDQFPSLGDYDFNDFVVNYKVQFQEIKGHKKDNYTAKVIQIGLRLRAIGGIFPYSPYLRLKEINAGEVESIEIYDSRNISPSPVGEIVIQQDDNEPLIIDCSILSKNLQKPAGSQYYNTERVALPATKDLPEIHFLIYLKERKEVEDILEDDEFDLYLTHDNNGTEIHLPGIEPVSYKYPFYDANLLPVFESDGDEEDDNYYYSKKKLIWGLRIPGNAAHAIEKANFLKAYKNFADWAQSGGKNNHNWYNQGNANQDLLIHN